jgi:hypothetical protein
MPEDIDFSKIKSDTKITLVTGQADLLSSPEDYNWLHEELKKQGCQVNQLDFPNGHLAIVIPSDVSVTDQIFEQIKKDY